MQITAYNILGNNYVKLRDIGQAVGFNVYYENGVQVDNDAPYTGEAPAQPATAESIRVGSYKGNTLKVNDRSGLIINPSGRGYTVTSSNPAVVDVENVSGNWVAVTKVPGSAVITVSDGASGTGSLMLTVEESGTITQPPAASVPVELNANMEIRQEMVRLINQVRQENGAAPLSISESLMNAAQDCSAQMNRHHNTLYECKAAAAYGYPHGFGDNLTWFSGFDCMEEIAQTAVTNWVNSPGHFQTMIDPRADCIGVGVTVRNQDEACCYMFTGDPNSIPAYD